MTKQAFLDELNRLAGGLGEAERARLVDYYREMIEDRVEEGVSEEEAVAALGDPSALAAELAGAAPRETPVAGGETIAALANLRVEVFNADVSVVREPLDNGAAAQLRFSDPSRFEWHAEGDTLAVRELEPEDGHRGLHWLMQRLTGPELRVTVALAGDLSGDLALSSRGGDLRVENAVLGSATLNTSNGDIKLSSVACGAAFRMEGGKLRLVNAGPAELRAHAISGDIEAKDVRVNGPARLESVSGDIEARGLECAELTLHTASGDIEFDRGQATGASVHTASGDVRLDELEADPTLEVESASGDVKLVRCIARQTRVKTASGDVDLRLEPLPCGYDISANTVSGDMHFDDGCCGSAPDADKPVIRIHTVSGDIEAKPA